MILLKESFNKTYNYVPKNYDKVLKSWSNKMSKLIPYGRQSINLDDIRSVTQALKSEFLTTGPLAKKFETKFKNYVGSKYAISCSSGTSGLHLALLALDVKKGDIVILPVINFIASVNMAHILGAKIYFADVDKFTGQMTPKL